MKKTLYFIDEKGLYIIDSLSGIKHYAKGMKDSIFFSGITFNF
jgi:hypothetical protein